MSKSRIGFDATDSEDFSEDDTTFTSNTSRTGNRSSRGRTSLRGQTPAATPRSASTRSQGSPRTPISARSASQTPSRSRIDSRLVDTPQPGPSRQVNTPRSAPAQPIRRQVRRKQSQPKATKLLRTIWDLQQSTKLLLPKLSFCRVVREILNSNGEFRMHSLALEALQEATEMYVTQFMEDAYRCTLHRGQVTLKPLDMVLVRSLRNGML